jgi:hypothetical protein
MREEPNPAVETADRAVLPLRMTPQDGIQRHLILTNKRNDTLVLVPILAE